MDIYMPGMNGLEALRILREKGQNTDVILVSAGKKGEIVNTAHLLGAFDYMIKPIPFSDSGPPFSPISAAGPPSCPYGGSLPGNSRCPF
ncbi:hypothetical protein MASR2M17_08610 [Aminivibrio sp.]